MSTGIARIEAPDELAAVLLQDRIGADFRCEIAKRQDGSWQVQVTASGPVALAAVLASTRAWLEAERIAATTVVAEGETYALERVT